MKFGAILSGSFLVFSLFGLPIPQALGQNYPWLNVGSYDPDQTIEKRIAIPEGFQRVGIESESFAEWLRRLPLRPGKPPVRLYPVSEGKLKGRQDVHFAVVDITVLRFQECADAIIRLRAEYLWSMGRADEVCFNFTSGDPCCWKEWRCGWRPRIVEGAKLTWSQTGSADASYEQFTRYLDKVMEYAGTASLSEELVAISPNQLKIGDVIIEGGFPGHAVLVLDMVEDGRGETMMLLGQSFMPAQEFHVLKNPGSSSPWYEAEFGVNLETPQWNFQRSHCRRFPDQMERRVDGGHSIGRAGREKPWIGCVLTGVRRQRNSAF